MRVFCRLVKTFLCLERGWEGLIVDVAEYFAAAKDVMKEIQDKAEESRRLLAKKMQVWPSHLEADSRNATLQKRRPDRDFLLYWMTNNLLSEML